VSVSLDHVAEALGFEEFMRGVTDVADEIATGGRDNGSEPKLRIVTPNGPETVSPDTGEKPDA
jgi:hypothetical protein